MLLRWKQTLPWFVLLWFSSFLSAETIKPKKWQPIPATLIHWNQLKTNGEIAKIHQIYFSRPMPRPYIPSFIGKKGQDLSDYQTTGIQMKPSPKVPSPFPTTNFLALEDDNTAIPPDTHGAVGSNHLMVTLNTQVRIQDRSGGVISTVSLDSFWNSLGILFAFDPKVYFDALSGRWIFVAIADGQLASSAVLLAVSQTDNPTGSWYTYKINASVNLWADYPNVGFNKKWIVININNFTLSDNNYANTELLVINKTNAMNGVAALSRFTDNAGFTIVPAITYDNAEENIYLLETWFGNVGGSGSLRMGNISGLVDSPVYNMGVTFPVAVGSPWNDINPGVNGNFASQAGIAQKIDAGDTRMQAVVYRNGMLWCTHTVFLPASGTATRCSIQWWQISPLGVVLQRGRIDDPAGNQFYAYPSLTVNAYNDVLIGYSRFAAIQFASANYSFRYSTDAANTVRDDLVLKAGEAKYFKDFGQGANRWGDYSATVVDPINDTDLWTIQEYAASPLGGIDRWGTWWGKIGGVATPPVITSPLFTNGYQGISFYYEITATGNPTNYGATNLPPGLNINSTNGTISGVPLITGTNEITLFASNASGTGSNILTLVIAPAAPPIITSPTNVSGNVEQFFSYSITATGFPTNYGAGLLPPGLSMDTMSGVISGILTVTGTQIFDVYATNPFGTGTGRVQLIVEQVGSGVFGDFTGDGFPDLITRKRKELQIVPMNGLQVNQPTSISVSLPVKSKVIGASFFNLDGLNDIFFQNRKNLGVLLMSNTTFLQQIDSFAQVPKGVKGIATGDLNRDGKTDVFFQKGNVISVLIGSNYNLLQPIFSNHIRGVKMMAGMPAANRFDLIFKKRKQLYVSSLSSNFEIITSLQPIQQLSSRRFKIVATANYDLTNRFDLITQKGKFWGIIPAPFDSSVITPKSFFTNINSKTKIVAPK